MSSANAEPWYKSKWTWIGGVFLLIIVLVVIYLVLAAGCKNSDSSTCKAVQGIGNAVGWLGKNIGAVFWTVVALIAGFATGLFGIMKAAFGSIGDKLKDWGSKIGGGGEGGGGEGGGGEGGNGEGGGGEGGNGEGGHGGEGPIPSEHMMYIDPHRTWS